MKNYVSGWRRGTPKPEAKGGAATAEPAPAAKAPAEIAEPSPAPITRRKAEKPAGKTEVIDAPAREAKPRQPIIVPSIPIPRGGGQIVMLAISGFVFWVSVQNTQTALVGPLLGPGADQIWSYAVQGSFSVIERFHFAGNRNALTRAVLIADALTNAAGLFLANINRVSDTPIYQMVRALPVLSTFLPQSLYTLDDGWRAALAILLGFALAWGGDKLFDMAGR